VEAEQALAVVGPDGADVHGAAVGQDDVGLPLDTFVCHPAEGRRSARRTGVRRRPLHTDLDLEPVWRDLELPRSFPPEVEAAAAAAADAVATADRRDATDVALVTVDPPGAMDLDQAVHIAPDGDGWVVHYAIADVAAFVAAGDPVDTEARRRGETLYLPDGRVPLHPPVLGEAAASLLPGEVRPAVLWRIAVAADGSTGDVAVERATVRSRSRHSYAEVQEALDAGAPVPEAVRDLPALGAARMALARRRGAIELGLPSQEVVRRGDGSWTIEHRAPLPVEAWNAQVSLLTGMAAAALMLAGGTGLLRTLPRPEPVVVERLRGAAPALGVSWPEGVDPGTVLAGLDARDPRAAAYLDLAAELLRGAGYTPVDGSPPPDEVGHAGVGAPYAHVTAPIRRLGDRFATEVALSVAAGREVPGWVQEALPSLPDLLATSARRARAVERAAVDHVEAWLLADRVGEVFDAAVVEHDAERDRSTVVLDDPAVRARCDGQPPLGGRIRVRLAEADLPTRSVRFTPA